MATLSVRTATELTAALQTANAGDTIELASGNYGSLDLRDYRYTGEVTITSADPSNPAVIDRLNLVNSNNITFDGIVFDYNAVANPFQSERPFVIDASSNIRILNSTFDGDLANSTDSTVDGYGTGIALYVKYSDGIEVSGNEFYEFYRGAFYQESQNLSITGNNVHSMRSDGMNFADVDNVLIEANYFHDFRAAQSSGDHADMIQFWTTNTSSPSENIIIRGNAFDRGTGDWTQTIFFGNEAVAKGAGQSMFYRDILIEDNAIRNAHLHGITVNSAIDVVVRNNTLVSSGNTSNHVELPQIRVSPDSLNYSATGNIAHGIPTAQSNWTVSGNTLLQVSDPGGANYYGSIDINSYLDPIISAVLAGAVPSTPAPSPTGGGGTPSTPTTPTPTDPDDPTDPGTGDPTEPGTDDPTDPGTGDPTDPGTDDPTVPVTPPTGGGGNDDDDDDVPVTPIPTTPVGGTSDDDDGPSSVPSLATILGTSAADLISASNAAEQIDLSQGGADVVEGSGSELANDVLDGFGEDDELIITGVRLDNSDINISTSASASVALGSAGSVSVGGDFDDAGLVVGYDGSSTVITLASVLDDSLEDRRNLTDAEINGVVNEAYLSGDNATSFRISVDDTIGYAYFENTLGVYEVDDAGNISDVRIIAGNVKQAGGDIIVDNVDPGKQLGFFLIQDGARALSPEVLASTALGLSVVDGALVLTDGGSVVEGATTFVSHDASLNIDGQEHVVTGIASDGSGAMVIGFEDMVRDAPMVDNDFEDVLLTVEAINIL